MSASVADAPAPAEMRSLAVSVLRRIPAHLQPVQPKSRPANQWCGDADDQARSPTGLANHVFTAVTGRTPDGIQGTTWWTVDGDEVPDGVDPAEWNSLGAAPCPARLGGGGY
ncbi:hypothetical protein [Kibdelosporangium phytohabitans]|uniref:hypothetical protein n=1 Tax=Kibdelosporangium phytohabitans TaxID=860235 RepID=UPI00146FE5E6|nr:hypothetical protein [Kibdelosporangium phytohabitans]MBE1470709.1 hypothetical protein [Kibdelosporangium phytohabitans]